MTLLISSKKNLNTIEDVAAFIADMLNEQAKGKLPFDLLFLWDSVGSVPCRLSVESNKNNNEWNAGAMSQQFAIADITKSFIIFRIFANRYA